MAIKKTIYKYCPSCGKEVAGRSGSVIWRDAHNDCPDFPPGPPSSPSRWNVNDVIFDETTKPNER